MGKQVNSPILFDSMVVGTTETSVATKIMVGVMNHLCNVGSRPLQKISLSEIAKLFARVFVADLGAPANILHSAVVLNNFVPLEQFLLEDIRKHQKFIGVHLAEEHGLWYVYLTPRFHEYVRSLDQTKVVLMRLHP